MILATAREFDQQFEWAANEPAALGEGLSQEIIDVVKSRAPAVGLGADESAIIAFGSRSVPRELWSCSAAKAS